MASRKALIATAALFWMVLSSFSTALVQDAPQHELTLSPLCSPQPEAQRLWRVTNFTSDDTAFEWNLVGTGQNGGGVVPRNGTVEFTTQPIVGPNVAVLRVDGVEHDIRESGGEGCQPTAVPSHTPTEVPPTATSTPQPCDIRNLRADLIGTLYDAGARGVITNIGPITCTYKVGIASYYKFDENIDNQIIYAFDNPTVTLASGESVELRAPVPTCAYQADLFYGDVIIPMFYGQRYSPRLLAYVHGGGDYCQPATATPTHTPAPPTATDTPTFTPVLPTATHTPTFTPAPPTATDTPTFTPVPPTATDTPTLTPVPPTATHTPTFTSVPPTATDTPTFTPIPPTATDTPTLTPVPPTATRTPTLTSVPPTATDTPTFTPIPPTATFTPTPIAPDCTFSVPAGDVYGPQGLVAAILAANGTPAADLICLTPGSTYILTGAYNTSLAGLPAITSPITLRGGGARIERGPSAPEFRLLTVDSNGSLALQNLTLAGGRTLNGGAIFSSGALTVSSSTFIDNVAAGGGGALYLDRGSATISDTTLTGSIANNGGAIYVAGANLTLQAGVTLEGNRAGNFGGGLLNFAGSITLTGTVLRENTALRGGGLYVSSTASVTGSQVSLGYNTASLSGGGLETDSASVFMTGGCFVSNNAASGTAARSNQPTAIDLTSNFWGRSTGPLPEELSGAFSTNPFLTVPPAECVVTAPIRGLGLDAVR